MKLKNDTTAKKNKPDTVLLALRPHMTELIAGILHQLGHRTTKISSVDDAQMQIFSNPHIRKVITDESNSEVARFAIKRRKPTVIISDVGFDQAAILDFVA